MALPVPLSYLLSVNLLDDLQAHHEQFPLNSDATVAYSGTASVS